MKHAGSAALDRLEPLLEKLRAHAALKEKSRGAFYRGGKAFLHFHEHGEEFFADVRLRDDFERFCATSAADRSTLLKKIAAALGDGAKK
ncbi:MAG: hypothetical protein HY243_11100 [Proteobacteria bacterium]|nr:hypothetical protein [Pseudomonadota bacterium]